ncbi:MAG: basic secretory protein-like protein [Bacteroidales bacterium]|jgi:Tol biopolymer transport system component|nr:basic secretory protein-like protein [Bacteroidales bacterium]
MMKKYFLCLLFIFFLTANGFAQFGQNKVMYDRFDFEVYDTPRFDIYNYLKNDSLLLDLGQLSERWYMRHMAIFADTLENSPIILYNNTADFKQTTVISGLIGVGTGGVTEGLRSRVVIPVMVSNKETDHVLGHEMVHVFQYNLVRENDSLSFSSLGNTPLWMIEGMAEFLSIGARDNRTSMWMRDAVIHDKMPSIKDMTTKPGEYFPYRYGHAFWAFVTGVWGDNIMQPLFYNTLRYGMEHAFQDILHMKPDSLSKIWAKETREYYTKQLEDTISPVGKIMFNTKKGGEINLSPVISPDGKYVTFLSNKNVINVDLLLAETKNGEIISKLTSSLRKSHIDDFNYIEESGSWSPDGKEYILTTFTQGKNKFIIVSLEDNKVKNSREIEIKGIETLVNPEWSPDGKSIVFNGMVNGQSDLYIYSLETGETEQLTNDYHSDLQPSWSADGEEVVFISDRGNDTRLEKQIYGTYKLCVVKRKTKQVLVYDLFQGADIFSPQFSPYDSSLYFLSNADGYRNLYRYEIHTGEVFKLTKFSTGITGITDLAPSYSVSRETGQIAYTFYRNGNYEIYLANPEDFLKIQVDPGKVNRQAEFLPPGEERLFNIVDHNLQYSKSFPKDSFNIQTYDPKFQLEYIGSNGVGAGTSTYGTFISGGVSMLFSDMLKYHQIYTMLNINGEVYDFGGQIAYINSKNRITWGGSFSHFPYRGMYYSYKYDSLPDGTPTFIENYNLVRIFEENFSLLSHFPLSSKLRLEGGFSYARYSYRIDSINYYYWTDEATGYPMGYIGQNKQKVEDVPDPYNLGSVYLAFVGDDSNFGITSPLSGYRYRFQVGQMFDHYQITNINFDYRKYFFAKPFSFAFRLLHYGRYGKSANKIYPIFLGNEYIIRGYNYNALYKRDYTYSDNYLDVNKISGSKILTFNAEVRFPFTGIERLSLIKSKYLYSDLNLFFDAGLAWTKDKFPWLSNSDVRFYWNPDPSYYTPIYSLGASLRINLFGYAVLEPYIAIPFQLEEVPFSTGFVISGGGW